MPDRSTRDGRLPEMLPAGPDLPGRSAPPPARISAACALILICVAAIVCAQSEVGYRANIGRAAVSATTGAEIGPIVDVALANGIWVYRVNRDGRTIAMPVESVRVRDLSAPIVRGPSTGSLRPAKVDSILLGTATNFRRRLAQNGGTLQTLMVTPKGISAEWISLKCAAFEPEVIGLIQSITATQKASPAIAGSRTCGREVRTFAISGATLDAYRHGEIGDPGVRAALKGADPF
jgi:hypothetical protein